jgi:hypothetical protein
MVALRSAYIVLVKRPVSKRSLGISRFRRENNIKMDLKEIGLEGVDLFILLRARNSCGLLWIW